MTTDLTLYPVLLGDIKTRIRQAQGQATIAANTEMILMYWDIGRLIMERQQQEGWGAGVLRRLAGDIKSELAEVKGFSERNLKRMTQFYREYPQLPTIGPRPVAQLESVTAPVNIRNNPLDSYTLRTYINTWLLSLNYPHLQRFATSIWMTTNSPLFNSIWPIILTLVTSFLIPAVAVSCAGPLRGEGKEAACESFISCGSIQGKLSS